MSSQPTLFDKYDLSKWLHYRDIPYGFSDGYAVVYIIHNDKRKYNYIDMTGKVLLIEWVDYACSFNQGYAIVTQNFNGNKKQNIIDTKGNYILKSWVDYIGEYSEGYYLIELGKKQNYIDRKGNLLFDERFDAYISEAIKINKSYDIGKFTWGRTAIKKDGMWNFVDENGNYLLKQWAQSIHFGFSEGFATIIDTKRELKYVNLLGNIQFEETTQKFISKIPELAKLKSLKSAYLHYYPFEGGIAKISYNKGRKHIVNFFDHSGNFLFDDEFLDSYDITSHTDSYFIVKNKDGLYNCVDLYGKFLSNERYKDIRFSGGNIKVCKNLGKKVRGSYQYKGSERNILDKKGNLLFKNRYNEIYYIKEDLFKVENSVGLSDIITTSGESILGWQNYIGTLSDEKYFIINDKNGKHLSDRYGNIIHPELNLDRIGQFRGGWAPVCIYTWDENGNHARNFMNYKGEFLFN